MDGGGGKVGLLQGLVIRPVCEWESDIWVSRYVN